MFTENIDAIPVSQSFLLHIHFILDDHSSHIPGVERDIEGYTCCRVDNKWAAIDDIRGVGRHQTFAYLFSIVKVCLGMLETGLGKVVREKVPETRGSQVKTMPLNWNNSIGGMSSLKPSIMWNMETLLISSQDKGWKPLGLYE